MTNPFLQVEQVYPAGPSSFLRYQGRENRSVAGCYAERGNRNEIFGNVREMERDAIAHQRGLERKYTSSAVVSIYDNFGRLVYKLTIPDGTETTTILIDTLSKGLYIVHVQSNEVNISGKFVKH